MFPRREECDSNELSSVLAGRLKAITSRFALGKLTRSVTSMEPSRTDLYNEFLAERQEILCHKWIESEKVGYDIDFWYC